MSRTPAYLLFAVSLVVGVTIWSRWNGSHDGKAGTPEITLRLTPAVPAAFKDFATSSQLLDPVIADLHPFTSGMSEAELRVRLHQSLRIDSDEEGAEPGVVCLHSSFPSPEIAVAFLSRLCDRIGRSNRVHQLTVKDLEGRRDSFAKQLTRIEKQIAKQQQFVSTPAASGKQRWSDLTDLVLQAAAETEIDLVSTAAALKQLPKPTATDPNSFLQVQNCLLQFMDAAWYEHGRFVKSSAQVTYEKAVRVRERLKAAHASKGPNDPLVLALQAQLQELEGSRSQEHWMERIVARGQSEALNEVVDFLDLLNAQAADQRTDPA
ncbi:MAG: hypothetical protein AAF394_04455, partial [Planctomycetota bacterium]